ncbi:MULTISPECIES: type VI secretion system TssO [Bacteroidales]|uniref:type VI secretion system TssO n=1 Tax=Bacteroidales TaxID=171549 RepID=UPI001F3AD1CA|nr:MULTISPECIES: type VI secretion system TssO [Bacteroidales]MCE8841104.1 type VI secretion system transmembrane protein TssO [Bacteroides thetaiotaomicron]MCE8861321.1 type VI secretion system transmembrane protein TssO [Phocaeicola vulgatus]MCE9042888.1 type VI secretion system transmembrane protein TssO [Parabacteroides distasonis]MCG4725633.1 type VI secretion system transmembrane protein TssO [Phocaeicola vulgatus]
MEAMNIEERKSAKWKFFIIFAVTLLIIALCGSISIVTAQKAIALLENKKSEYDEVFKKHAELNFQIEELFRELNSLKGKKRNASEHKHLQNLITKKRQLMENEISSFESNGQNYEVYKVMLNQIKEIQATMDNLDREAKKRESNIEQLEKCRNKYQELTKEKLQKP